MNSKIMVITFLVVFWLAASGVRAEGGASAREMMQKMDMMEKMEMTDRMEMEEQLDAAKTCANQFDFNCANTYVVKAKKLLTQNPADQHIWNQACDYIRQQMKRYEEALAQQQQRQEQQRQAAVQRASSGGNGGNYGNSPSPSYGSSTSYNAPSYTPPVHTAPSYTPPAQTYHYDNTQLNRAYDQAIKGYSRNR